MTQIRFLVLILTVVALSANAVLTSNPARPTLVVPLLPHPGGTEMMTVHATVRGHEGNFMFDTGAGTSYISPAFAQTVGCKPWGQITGFTLTGQRLDMPRCEGLVFNIGGQNFAGSTTGVFDIMKFMPANVPQIDGSIGLDAFSGRAVTLSLADRKLIVESPASLRERMKRGKELRIRLVREAGGASLSVYVAVPTSEGMAWMEFDCGNGGNNVIGKHLATVMKLDPNSKEPQQTTFTLAGGIPVDGPVRVNQTLIVDGNIGVRFMRNWDLTIDLEQVRAWLAPASSARRATKVDPLVALRYH